MSADLEVENAQLRARVAELERYLSELNHDLVMAAYSIQKLTQDLQDEKRRGATLAAEFRAYMELDTVL